MPDEYLTCPYNRMHRILNHRMPYHLIKCRKNYCGEPLQTCIYNAMHIVPPMDMKKHLETCQDFQTLKTRDLLDKMYDVEIEKQTKTNLINKTN